MSNINFKILAHRKILLTTSGPQLSVSISVTYRLLPAEDICRLLDVNNKRNTRMSYHLGLALVTVTCITFLISLLLSEWHNVDAKICYYLSPH